MKIKKIIGFTLAFIAVIAWILLLINHFDLKSIIIGFGITFLFVLFVWLVMWLINSD